MEIKDKYKQHHDAIFEKRYESPYVLRRFIHRKQYEDIVNLIKPEDKVLDTGCGEGVIAMMLAKKGVQVTAVDISEPNIESAKKLADKYNLGDKIKFTVADSEDLPFCDESFDVVISSHVLEHLPSFDKGLSEIYRVSRKKAIIALPTCLNGCSMVLVGGGTFWKFGLKSVWHVFFGFCRTVIGIFGEGVDEGYAGMNLPHIRRYPWVIRKKIKKAGFKIINQFASTICVPYNFYLTKFLTNFSEKKIFRNLGHGMVFVVIKNNNPNKD